MRVLKIDTYCQEEEVLALERKIIKAAILTDLLLSVEIDYCLG
jgi:hypothetical protein